MPALWLMFGLGVIAGAGIAGSIIMIWVSREAKAEHDFMMRELTQLKSDSARIFRSMRQEVEAFKREQQKGN
jgi:hypothetical protein